MRHLSVWLAALWWGSLTTVGFMVVPMLFAHLATPAIAGGMAARLFTAQNWVSLALCVLLLVLSRAPRWPAQSVRVDRALPWILGGALLAALVEFAVSPRIVARQNLALWHALGSAMYLLQWLCAALTLRGVLRPGPGEADQV